MKRTSLLLTVVLLAAGCGGGPSSPSIAKLGAAASKTQTTGNSANSSGASAGPTLAYSQCMRANGEPKFPDPSASGGIVIQSGSGVDPFSPAFKAAQSKCRKLMPGGGPPAPGSSTHPTAKWLAQMIAAAACMRRHGISGFPDPTTTVPAMPRGGGEISVIDGVVFLFPSSIDTGSPAFVRAATTCGFPLHNH